MATSQNGWAVLFDNDTTGAHPRLRKGVVPGTARHLFVRDGSAALLLLDLALWFHEELEPLDKEKTWDDWGWAVRPVRGQTSGYSNHASGTAIDLNATQHPRGVRGTFTDAQEAAIRKRLERYDGCIRAGEFYSSTVDGMHFELDRPLADCERVARRILDTRRGKRVCEANPGLRAVVLS